MLAYLGFRNKGREFSDSLDFVHKFNAIPPIAYYDIFKNYYANKQEENFYTIGLGQTVELPYPNTQDNPIKVMIKPGGGADWTLSKTNSIDTYTIKTGYDSAIIEVGNSIFPASGNIEDLVLLGEYGGKPGSLS